MIHECILTSLMILLRALNTINFYSLFFSIMKKLIWLIVIILLGGAAFVLFKQKAPISEPVGLANPASVNCLNNWWTLEIIDTTWWQIGMCTLSDGTVCEERAYMRGECGATTEESNEPVACTQEAKICDDGTAVERTWPNCEFAPCPGEEPIYCTMEYAPVCASVAIQCVTTPCDPIEQTFGNRCMMNANKLATFLYEGECETDCPQLAPPAPTFCIDGTIVDGGKDENWCQLPPTCKK